MLNLLKVSNFVRAVTVLGLFAGLCVKSQGQLDAQLQALDSHLAGAWVGTNYDYTKTPMVSNPVRIEIKENPKKRELRLEYTYGTKGQQGYDHLVRFIAIKPAQSIIEFHWQHKSLERYQVSGLDGVLSTGYGDFTCAGTVHTDGIDLPYRCVFHIEAEHFSYSWEKSEDGVTFSKTGQWVLTREPTRVGLHPTPKTGDPQWSKTVGGKTCCTITTPIPIVRALIEN